MWRPHKQVKELKSNSENSMVRVALVAEEIACFSSNCD